MALAVQNDSTPFRSITAVAMASIASMPPLV
jgi:hypothetical protein